MQKSNPQSNKQLTVLHISNTNINHDGRIIKQIEALKESGLKLNVIGLGVYQEEDKEREDYGKEMEGSLIKNLTTDKLNFLPRALKYIFMLIEFTFKAYFYGKKVKADIVHCHDAFALPAGRLLAIHGAKIIYDAHELESNKNGQSKALSRATLWIEKVCWDRISGFLTVSQKILEWYHEHFSSKISCVVLNAPKVTIKQPLSGGHVYLKEKFSIPKDSLVFVYVGILNHGRGIEKLLKVFSSGVQSHLVFLGYGPMEVDIDKLASGCSNIHRHPAVTHDMVTSTIYGADYGFSIIENSSLSDYLCLPNKLFEYAQANVTVIGSNFPEIERVLEKHQLGFVIEDDELLIAQLVNQLETSNVELEAQGLHELSWESQERKLVSFYQQVINKNFHN